MTFHYTGWLIGILILVYYNPYITGWYNPLCKTANRGFEHCSSCKTKQKTHDLKNNSAIITKQIEMYGHDLPMGQHVVLQVPKFDEWMSIG